MTAGLLERILGMPDVRAEGYGPGHDFWYSTLAGASATASGVPVTADTALAVAAVYACVRVIAEDMGSAPLHTFRRLSGGAKERIMPGELPFARKLEREPNRDQGAMEWREMMTGHALLRGNAYSQIVPGASGFMEELVPLNPERMKVERLPSGSRLYTYRTPDARVQKFAQAEIFHLAGLSFDGLTGVSVVGLAREAIGVAQAGERVAALQFGQGLSPSGVLQHPGSLSDEAQRNLRESFMERNAGLQHQRKPLVLEEGMTWHQLGMTSEDAQFIESRKWQIEELARFFRMPHHKIGIMERSTFCLPGDAQVLTALGPKPIADIQAGEQVWSRDGESWVLSRVEAAAQAGVDDVLEIKTGIRTLRANPKHVVPVRRKGLVPFDGGRGQTTLIDGERYRQDFKIEWIPAGEIEIGDELLALNGVPDSGSVASPTRDCSGITYTKVRSIRRELVQVPVYDLSVAKTHNFVADGVLVRNSNIEHQAVEYVVDTLRPWAVRWEQRILRQLISRPDLLFVEFQLDGFLRGDIKSRYEAYQVAWQHGWLNDDEIRAKENMNPREDVLGRTYMRPANIVPFDTPVEATRGMRGAGGSANEPAGGAITPRMKLLAEEMGARLVRKEVDRVAKAAKKFAADATGWEAWCADFYGSYGAEVARSLCVAEASGAAYAEQQQRDLLAKGIAVTEDWLAARPAELARLALEGA